MFFWLFTTPDDALGYSLIFLILLLPISTFVISVIIGAYDFFQNVKWFMPIILGVMYMLCEYATFSAKNMVTFNHFNLPDFEMILNGGFISLVGLGLGMLIKYIKSKKKNN